MLILVGTSSGDFAVYINKITTFYNDVRIEGDLNVTGNVTAENIFIPQDFYTHTQENLSVDTAGHWYNVTFDEEQGIGVGILHVYDDPTNDTFTIVEDGVYKITVSIGLVDIEPLPNNVIVIRFTKNNVEIHGSAFEKDSTKQNEHITMHHTAISECSAGDKIRFQFTASDDTVFMETLGTYADHPDSASIYIEKKRD